MKKENQDYRLTNKVDTTSNLENTKERKPIVGFSDWLSKVHKTEVYRGKKAESKTETHAYVPSGDRIQTLLGAGKRLVGARAELYDWMHNQKDFNVNHELVQLRSPHVDLADIAQLKRANDKRLRELQQKIVGNRASKKEAEDVKSNAAEGGAEA